MVNKSKEKGSRAEYALKKILRDATGLNFQRTPGSGALNEAHKLKGDLYVVNAANKFCIEVKHYKDDHLTSKILSSKSPQLIEWWEQAVRQGEQVDMIPLLFFKHDRGKWFMATLEALEIDRCIDVTFDDHFFSIYKVEDIDLKGIAWTL